MYKVNIVKLPKNVLRKKSQNVPIPLSEEDVHLAETMIYHVDDSQKPKTRFRPAVGVAAVQYGILKNVFYIHVKDHNDKTVFRDVLFNPEVLSKSESVVALSDGEGCLSVKENWPGQQGYVPRSARIKVKAYSYFKKEEVIYDVVDYVAIVFQHELDHLNGNLFIDRINTKNPWSKKSDWKLL
ncbi:peptide deformylase [Mycoplasma sp. Ms02]|uniref:peptide deformylase n=1 Tax=Mycoplasma sp. Ms02 TaxID=353851 RepID=UPI001C8AFAFE|nr:peptide deformylase [Mycoplasma sp. Ms02]QZE12669.1 peptide deformylase [Mycoplasma sp. Ms02]